AWNLITEIIGTFVLVFVILLFGKTPSGLGPLAVALLVVGIGASRRGPTGSAITPPRDLGRRIAHAILPIRGKGDSDWGYSWIPVVGPIIGGILARLLAKPFIVGQAARPPGAARGGPPPGGSRWAATPTLT